MAAKKVTVMVGFVPIATKMEVAVDEESSGTHAVCTGTEEAPHDPARVKMSVGCTACDIKHSSVFGFLQRGVERANKLVVLTKEEIAAAAGAPRTGRVGGSNPQPPVPLAFHPREKVYGSTVAGDSVQNIYPDKGGEGAYILLRDALIENPDVVACMIWAPTSKNSLWVLEVFGERIVASKRAWPETVRATVAIPQVEVLDAERDMFSKLVQAKVEDFDLLTYSDQAKLGLEELIAARAADATAMPTPVGRPVSTNLSMLEALTASLEAAKPVGVPNPKKRAPAKKAAAKKAPAKRTAAKKATVSLAKSA